MAAEAAIANPLLDETSMKGARGLLISITGGNDLTLYEVDEAASRIRQEVDEEANIILGATFDSALDGVVRVSVVATGIDQATIDQIEPVAAPPLAAAAARARVVPPRPLPAAIEREEPVEPAPLAASALDDVEIRPVAPRATAYVQPLAAAHEEETIEREFIPPAPEQPPLRAPRMPQIEELPPIAQNQLRAHRGEAPSRRRRPRRAAGRCWRSSPLSASAATRTTFRRRARSPRRRSRSPRRGRPPPRCTPNMVGRNPDRPRRVPSRVNSTRTAARRSGPLARRRSA